jgi:hypothetical protein
VPAKEYQEKAVQTITITSPKISLKRRRDEVIEGNKENSNREGSPRTVILKK